MDQTTGKETIVMDEHNTTMRKPCGTNAAYVRHLRYGEQPCGPCALAHREYMRDYMRTYKKVRVDHHADGCPQCGHSGGRGKWSNDPAEWVQDWHHPAREHMRAQEPTSKQLQVIATHPTWRYVEPEDRDEAWMMVWVIMQSRASQ